MAVGISYGGPPQEDLEALFDRLRSKYGGTGSIQDYYNELRGLWQDPYSEDARRAQEYENETRGWLRKALGQLQESRGTFALGQAKERQGQTESIAQSLASRGILGGGTYRQMLENLEARMGDERARFGADIEGKEAESRLRAGGILGQLAGQRQQMAAQRRGSLDRLLALATQLYQRQSNDPSILDLARSFYSAKPKTPRYGRGGQPVWDFGAGIRPLR